VIFDDIKNPEAAKRLELFIGISIQDKIIQKENDNREDDETKNSEHSCLIKLFTEH
jgi:hypothetical protein